MNGIPEVPTCEDAPSANRIISTEKRCSKCGEIKPVGDFYVDKHEKSGLTSACKICRHITLKHWRISNKERYNYHSLKNHHKNVASHTVHTYVSYHVKKGHIARPDTCSVCGNNGTDIHAHHSDYSKRFDILWVCRKCHKDIHKMLKDGSNG